MMNEHVPPMSEFEFVRLVTAHHQSCLDFATRNCPIAYKNQITVGVYYSRYFTQGNILFVTLPPCECPSLARGCHGVETFTVVDKGPGIDKYAHEVYARLKLWFGRKELKK